MVDRGELTLRFLLKVATVGAIALQGVRRAEVTLGERVAGFQAEVRSAFTTVRGESAKVVIDLEQSAASGFALTKVEVGLAVHLVPGLRHRRSGDARAAS